VTDEEIRTLLRELGATSRQTPPGFVGVAEDELAARADVPTVAVWIANQGGMVEPARDGLPETFLVPQRALDDG